MLWRKHSLMMQVKTWHGPNIRLSNDFNITGVLKPGVRRPLQRLQSEEERIALTAAVVHTEGRLE